ncbi:MAG: hypothetical protein ACYTG1_13270 [Planctomycetota bacterium]|jgi:hypothetical protein
MPIRPIPLAVLLLLAVAAPAAGQPVTTVLTHGYSLDQTKGVWVEGMADAIIARGGGAGAVCRYRQSDGAWQLLSGSLQPGDPVALIHNWLNDFDKAGPDLGFAEGAADALVAALLDPRFVDGGGAPIAGIDLVAGRDLHFLGHSRGAVVNSEAVQRFAALAIPVDHLTSFDPHPVNGTLDADPDWGDPTPQVWSNVTFADNYWRADGAFLFNAFDFDGIPIPGAYNVELDESALNSGGYSFAHSDTHLWYHGTIDLAPTPCDGEQCITSAMRTAWWPGGYTTVGFHYAVLGGGVARRPMPAAGMAPGVVAALYNGGFAQLGQAGWRYHGGDLGGLVVTDGSREFLELGPGGELGRHNRFFLPERAMSLRFDHAVLVPDVPGGDDRLSLVLTDRDGVVHDPGIGVDLFPAATGWITGSTSLLPGSLPRGRVYTLTASVAGGASVDAVAGIDAIEIVPAPDGDATLDGVVDVADILAVLADWGPCPPPCPPRCPGDVNLDCMVDVGDLLAVLGNWD